MTRSEFVEEYTASRVAQWLRTNTHSSPSGTSKPRISPQHVESFRRMAEEEADGRVHRGEVFDETPALPAHAEETES